MLKASAQAFVEAADYLARLRNVAQKVGNKQLASGGERPLNARDPSLQREPRCDPEGDDCPDRHRHRSEAERRLGSRNRAPGASRSRRRGPPLQEAPEEQGYTPFAKGGLVTRATYALVGEAGPEAVIPLNRLSEFGQSDNSDVVTEISAMRRTLESMSANQVRAFRDAMLMVGLA
jgi:hypothetical protein